MKKRKLSTINIYHVILRGNNKQQIFYDKQDYEMFLDALKKSQKKYGYKMYAGSLLSNHIHLIIHAPIEIIANIMRSIGASFVKRYNYKYNRVGSLFQPRYRSSPINSIYDLAHVARYIHRNPLKAGLCQNIEDYVYSSIQLYTHSSNKNVKFLALFDKDFILNAFEKSEKDFLEFNQLLDSRDDIAFNIGTSWLDRDAEALKILEQILNQNQCLNIDHLDNFAKHQAVKILATHNCTSNQIARILHMPKKIVTPLANAAKFGPPEDWTYIH